MTQINEIMKRVNTGDAVLIVMSDWNSFLRYGKLLRNVPITQKMFCGNAIRCIWNMSALFVKFFKIY